MKVSDSIIDNTTTIGIQFRADATIELTNVTVINGQKGGAVIIENVKGFVKNCKFNQNAGIGLEVANLSDSLCIEGCEFNNNSAGGLVAHDKCEISLINSQTKRNGSIGLDASGEGNKIKIIGHSFEENLQIGLHASSGSEIEVTKSRFANNGQIGLAAVKANPHLIECEITQNQQAGLAFSEASKALIENCQIHDNQNFGMQVHMPDTYVKMINTKVSNHLNSLAVIVLNDAKVRCIGCSFETTLQPHFEIRQGGKVSLKECEIMNSSKGIGVQVHDDGILKLDKTQIHNESKIGIMLGEKGKVQAKKSKIYDCGTCGVYTQPASIGEFEECEFYRNGQTAFQISGEVILKSCVVSEHSAYGVLVNDGGIFKEENSQFSNNGQENIHHQ